MPAFFRAAWRREEASEQTPRRRALQRSGGALRARADVTPIVYYRRRCTAATAAWLRATRHLCTAEGCLRYVAVMASVLPSPARSTRTAPKTRPALMSPPPDVAAVAAAAVTDMPPIISPFIAHHLSLRTPISSSPTCSPLLAHFTPTFFSTLSMMPFIILPLCR